MRLSNGGDEPCPDTATAHDYDQLSAEAKQYLAEVDPDQAAVIELPTEIATSFGPNDVINYTSYLQVADVTGEY